MKQYLVIKLAFLLILITTEVMAQRTLTLRDSDNPRSQDIPRRASAIRYNEAAALNEKIAYQLFHDSKFTKVASEKSDEHTTSTALQMLNNTGRKFYVMEAKPYGENGVSVLFIASSSAQTATLSKDPSIDSWLKQTVANVQSHEVDYRWLPFIAKKFAKPILEARKGNLANVLFTVISSELKLGSLVTSPTNLAAQAFFECSVASIEIFTTFFVPEIRIGLAAAATLTGIFSAGISAVGLVSSIAACGQSLGKLYTNVSKSQSSFDDLIAKQEETGRNGGGHQTGGRGGRGEPNPRAGRNDGPTTTTYERDRSYSYERSRSYERTPERARGPLP